MTAKRVGPVVYRVGSGKEVGLFEDLRNRCGGLVVSGHTGAYFRSSITGLIRSLDAPFFVDPALWMLARDPGRIRQADGQLRKSLDKYVDELGDEVERIVRKGGRSLKASDFHSAAGWNEKLANEVVDKSLQSQRDFVDSSRQQTLDELLEMAGSSAGRGKQLSPAFLVAPYFFAENTADPWYQVTVELLRRALAKRESTPVYGVVCLPKDILMDSDARKTLVRDYSKADGVLVWISGFHDNGRESETTIRGFIELVQELSRNGKPCYSLYGGFPSLLLTKLGLTAVCHGLCYGDSKSVDQQPSFGPPPPRFYLPFAKSKLPLIDARAMYATHPVRPCGCSECASLGSSKVKWTHLEVNTYFRKLRSNEALPKIHFASCRWDEALSIGRKSLAVSLSEWKSMWTSAKTLEPESFGVSGTAIDTWTKLLSEMDRS